MSYRLALGGLGLTAVAVLAAGGCRAARPAALDDAALWHNGTYHAAPGQGFRLATPAPQPRTAATGGGAHAAPPAQAHPAPRPVPVPIRIVPPRLRHLPPLRPRGDWRPVQPPVHACSTVSLGRGGGTSVQCIQRSDEVIATSNTRTVRDYWPDSDWSDGDRVRHDGDWPELGWGHDD